MLKEVKGGSRDNVYIVLIKVFKSKSKIAIGC
jgi:hypothetical protein